MVSGVLIFLIIFCLCIAITSVAVTAHNDVRKLRVDNMKLRTDILELQITQRQLDDAVRNLKARKHRTFPMGYKSVSGDMDIMRGGHVATVKATFRPDHYV